MSVKLTAADLDRATTAGILQPGQARALLQFLEHSAPPHASFQLAHVSYYCGAVLIIGALGWLLTEAWMQVGDGALLLLALGYMGLFSACGLGLWRHGQQIPGGLLGAVAVSLTPLAVFAVQRLSGLWPLEDEQHDYQHYYRYVQGGWLAMEAATLLVGALMLRLLPLPFIVMPMAVALWFMSMDLTELFYGSPFDWEQRRWVSLWFGLGLLLASLGLDGRTRQDYAFWGYLAGLAAFWGGLSLMDSDSELGKALYCLINLVLMALAVLLRRVQFMVFGALGVAGYLGHLAYEVFADSLLFPILLSLIGLAVIGLGLLYQRHRQRLSGGLRTHLPKGLLAVLPALRNH
ncbi:DUF2157 domain-containing protein [Pseudomonas sp. MBLB4136]|uniref:DUF2157 domain-containing protein n=1 Tax=Pseudomonas sp. MBLB4136 TaxID=3451558 RepID=UPI003F750ED7